MGSKQIFEVISSIKGVDLNLESEFISVSSVSLLEVAEKFKNSNLAGHVLLTKGERSSLATIASQII